MLFCKYRDIFGKPHETIHKERIFKTDTFEGFAKNDLIATVVLALMVALIWSYYNVSVIKPFLVVFIFLILLSQILHYLFCVQTPFVKYLTSSSKI